jgi:uncharacterized protein YbbK (DUF523 family)
MPEQEIFCMKKIMISSCLMGSKVRYNGSDLAITSPLFSELISLVEVIPFCPEVSGGLATPRAPAEIIKGTGYEVLQGESRVINNEGIDVTEAFLRGAELALHICLQHGISVALLTESSPSCGSNTIHNGEFKGIKIPGKGVTTALLEKNGIRVFNQNQLSELIRGIQSELS